MTFKTTHEERVEKLCSETIEAINGMWSTLLAIGTQEARDAFEAAAKDAGLALLVPGHEWRVKE